MWLIPSSIHSVCAPASGCSISGCTSVSNISDSAAALWVTSSGTPTQRLSSWHGWKTRRWSLRLFGLATWRLSDGDAGLDAWTGWLRASRASRGVMPASGPDKPTSAGCGPTSLESFARLNPGFASSKTCLDLFQEVVLNTCYLTLPASGTMRNGRLLKRPTLAPITSGSGCLSWPTPRANDSEKRGAMGNDPRNGLPAAVLWPTVMATDYRRAGLFGRGNPTLPEIVKRWGTPTASENSNRTTKQAPTHGKGHGLVLAGQAGSWQIPTAGNFWGRGGDRRREAMLDQQARHWPTPAARDYKGANGVDHLEHGTGRLHLDQLPNFVQFRFSPRGRMIQRGSLSLTSTRNCLPPSWPTASASTGTDQPDLLSRARLNPGFAAWLMGWPWWWTNPAPISCAVSEMVLWRCKLLRHLSCLLGEQDLPSGD